MIPHLVEQIANANPNELVKLRNEIVTSDRFTMLEKRDVNRKINARLHEQGLFEEDPESGWGVEQILNSHDYVVGTTSDAS